MLKLTAKIESFDGAHYLASVINNEKFKGIMVQGDCLEDAIKELLISLRVKVAYDYNMDISSVVTKMVTSEQELKLDDEFEKEINFELTV